MTHLTPYTQAWAVCIADSVMRSDIECECVATEPMDSHRYGLVAENGSEVTTLAESAQIIQDAYAYLSARGLAELVQDTHDDVIHLHADRFPE